MERFTTYVRLVQTTRFEINYEFLIKTKPKSSTRITNTTTSYIDIQLEIDSETRKETLRQERCISIRPM
jgi:hypothetical protein